MKITMIGHSTILIETDGIKILTDPFFNKWGNPAYARIGVPAMTREELSNVDLVLVSHDHWDHTDGKYFRLIGHTRIIAPSPASWWIRAMGTRNVHTIGVGQKISVGDSSITVVPAIHITNTVGYLIQSEDKQVYFAGDTYFGSFMETLGQKFDIDVALMPVTTYRLPMTMGETGAVRAVRTMTPTTVIPIHEGITPRSPLLRTGQTLEHFAQRLKEAGIQTNVVILHNGDSFSI
jgi:L-ascorbate metabolism protein UlaG (beta-lactamase superfamily)